MSLNERVYISKKACWKSAKEGRDYHDAYVFTKLLASYTKHPILFNYKSNLTAYRLLTGLTDRKFRQLLNSAEIYSFVRKEGVHMRLCGKRADKKLFGYKGLIHEPVSTANLQRFDQIAIIEHNIKQQQRKYNHKISTMQKCGRSGEVRENMFPHHKFQANDEVTLSVRSAAKLLGQSVSCAHGTLTTLKAFGLNLEKNELSITRAQFKYYLSIGSPNIRYSIYTNECMYIKARKVSVEKVRW